MPKTIRMCKDYKLKGQGEVLGNADGAPVQFWKSQGRMSVPTDLANELEKEKPQRYEIVDEALERKELLLANQEKRKADAKKAKSLAKKSGADALKLQENLKAKNEKAKKAKEKADKDAGEKQLKKEKDQLERAKLEKDLFKLNESQQLKQLLAHKLPEKEAKALKYEADRVSKLADLMLAKKAKKGK